MMDVDSDDYEGNCRNRFRHKFPTSKHQAAQSNTDENVVIELKNKVKKKKGRGFKETSGRSDSLNNYERVRHLSEESDDDGESNFPQRSVEGWILMVTNLHEEIQEEDIMDKFGDFGLVKNMHLNLDRRTGFVKGYCLVEFETYREALLAKEAMDNSKILGQTILVDWVFVKNPRKILVSESARHRRNRRHYN